MTTQMTEPTEVEAVVNRRGRTGSPGRRPGSRSGRRQNRSPWYYLLVPAAWSLAIFDILVVVWMVLSSFKSTRELFIDPFGLPDQFYWSNYADAWQTSNLGEGVINSLILVFASGTICLALAGPAAYALSRFGTRSAGPITIVFVMGLGIPAQTIFIPLYVAMDRVNLTNSIFGLFLVYTATSLPFAVFLLTAFFKSLPRELEEAAALDGARPSYTFWRIMLPLARSGLITVFVLQAIGHWGETFFALVFLEDQRTISVSLLKFMQTMQYTGARWSVLFAGLTLVILPLIALYLWLGSRIIEGIAAGYSK